MEKIDVSFEPIKTKQKDNKVITTHTCKFPFTEQNKPVTVSKIIMTYDKPININDLLDSSFKLGKRHIYGFKEISFATVFYNCLLYKQKCKISENKLVIKPYNMYINSFVSVFDREQTTKYFTLNDCRFRTTEQISMKILIETTDNYDLDKTLSAYRIPNPFNGVFFGDPRFIVVSRETESRMIGEALLRVSQKNDTFDIINMSYTIDVSDSLCIESDNHIINQCDMIIKKIGDYDVYFIPLQFIRDHTLYFTSMRDITDSLKSKYLIDQPCTGLTDINISTYPPNAIEICHIICVDV